jgi:hypothetical protein
VEGLTRRYLLYRVRKGLFDAVEERRIDVQDGEHQTGVLEHHRSLARTGVHYAYGTTKLYQELFIPQCSSTERQVNHWPAKADGLSLALPKWHPKQ